MIVYGKYYIPLNYVQSQAQLKTIVHSLDTKAFWKYYVLMR